VKIIFKRKWLSHVKGDIMNVTEHLAHRLMYQNTARAYNEERDGKSVQKQVRRAPHNKMMAGAKSK